uniref:Negative elongation factor D n=1 Tax=Trichuris muris TaxID=70415 RepID=A0A5S6QM64_TRIMR
MSDCSQSDGDDGWCDTEDLESQDSAFTPEEVIEQCLARFHARDYILEPAVQNTIKRYLDAGGSWDEMVALLTAGYEGYPQLCNLLAEWLVLLGDDVEELKELFENRLDEFISQKFDPRKADTIFHQQSDESKIQWLADLISNPSSRRMVLDLAERFPDCLLLNFGVKLMADAGFLHEISSKVATSLEQQEIFTRVLSASIVDLLDYKPDTDGYRKTLSSLKEVVCCGEHTYLLTQSLLHIISARESRYVGFLRRLIHEFRWACHELKRDCTNLTISLYASTNNYEDEVLDAMRSILSRNQLSVTDVNVLFDAYHGRKASSVELIRDPVFMELLLESLFSYKSTLQEDVVPKYIFLLAFASVMIETKGKGRPKKLQMDPIEELNYCRTQLTQMRFTLLTSTTTNLLLDLNLIFSSLRQPAVAAGAFHWVRSVVLEADFYQRHTESLPIHFILLDEIATLHGYFHRKIFELYKVLFESDCNGYDVLSRLGRQRVLIDRMLNLVNAGYLQPVMYYIRTKINSEEMDLSLTRYFVVECLEFAGPPYSLEFLEAFSPIARRDGILDTMAEKASQLLLEFYDYLSAVSH